MKQAHDLDFDPLTQEVFDLLRRQPGDVFTVDAIAEELGYTVEEVAPGLARLEGQGLANRAQTDGGAEGFICSPSAPEL